MTRKKYLSNRLSHQIRINLREAATIYYVITWAEENMTLTAGNIARLKETYERRYARLLDVNVKDLQTNVTLRSVRDVTYILYWYIVCHPSDREVFARYYDKYTRLTQVLTYKRQQYGY